MNDSHSSLRGQSTLLPILCSANAQNPLSTFDCGSSIRCTVRRAVLQHTYEWWLQTPQLHCPRSNAPWSNTLHLQDRIYVRLQSHLRSRWEVLIGICVLDHWFWLHQQQSDSKRKSPSSIVVMCKSKSAWESSKRVRHTHRQPALQSTDTCLRGTLPIEFSNQTHLIVPATSKSTSTLVLSPLTAAMHSSQRVFVTLTIHRSVPIRWIIWWCSIHRHRLTHQRTGGTSKWRHGIRDCLHHCQRVKPIPQIHQRHLNK